MKKERKALKDAKKIDLPKENPELVELRAYQNCLYFLSSCSVQLGDPGKVYQTAHALGEVYSVLVPKVKELAKKNNIPLPGDKDHSATQLENKEKNNEKA